MQEMMAVGKEQANAAGLNNIHWVVSKAQQVRYQNKNSLSTRPGASPDRG
jgi:ubiquinone/menaquinone biosynthesis C-methylase UbiE